METKEIYETLFIALGKFNSDALVVAAFDIMQMPIVVTDATFVVTGKYPLTPCGDEQWDANVVGKQIESKYIDIFLRDNMWEAYGNDYVPIYTNWGYFAEQPRYACAIVDNGEVLGYVSALATGFECEEWHTTAMLLISRAFSIGCGKRYQESRYGGYLSGVLLQGLLAGEFKNEEEFDRMYAITGETLKPGFVLMSVKTRNLMNKPFESYIGSKLREFISNVLTVVQNEKLYVLLCGVSDGFDKQQSFRDAVVYLKTVDASCGFSRRFEHPYPLTTYKWQADKALEIGSAIKPQKSMFHYDDLISEIMLSVLKEKAPLENFVHPSVVRLSKYDVMHNTDYMMTLKTYLSNSSDKAATAVQLRIHRNTLRYRLEKIKEITGLENLEGPAVLFLYLSLLVSTNPLAEPHGK
ncbi:MAG: hypothetical protein HGA54_01545 [Actinobacteria bacterium]|nr:hypothetical protein [Actinomycetota bacterium]